MIVDLPRAVPGTFLDTPPGMATTPGALGEPEPADEAVAPGILDALGAHFRYDNILFSLGASEASRVSNEPDPDFSAWASIEGTDKEQFWDRYVDVGNQAQFDAVSRDIDRETEGRKIMEATPWWMSVPMTLAANILDPTILIPGGAFVRGAKGGVSVMRSAMNVGLATGAAVSVQEAGLQATQQLRTAGESATYIGASVLLGGLLGAGGAKLMSRAEWRGATAALERDIAEAVPDNSPFPAPVGAAIGAQRAPGADIDALTIAGRAAGATAKATSWINPGLRLMRSESAQTRDAALNLFESTVYLKGADQGIAAPRAVESLIETWSGGLADASTFTRDSFSAYRKRAGPGALSRREFAEAVGKAMRRRDVHEIPEVAAAAKAWRSNVFDPLKDAAIEAKLLPEDVSVDTAASYFSRMYNKRLAAEEHLFKNTVAEWVTPKIDADVEAARRLDWAGAQLKSWTKQIRKLEARIERSEAAVERIGERAAERGMEAGKTAQRVETLQARNTRIAEEAVELSEDIDLMEQLVRGTPVLSEPLRKAAEALQRRIATLRVERGRGAEAGTVATRNARRLRALEERLQKAEDRKVLLEEMAAAARDFRIEVRAAIEKEILSWGGDSAKKAKAAIAAREERAATRAGDAKRLASADKAVDRAVRRIVKQLQGKLSDLERATYARDIANDVFDKLTGRSSDSVRPYTLGIEARGPMKARTFNVPDELIERWLESDIDLVGRQYHRIMSADIELTRKFGDVGMTDQIKAIRDDYAKLRQATTDEKKLVKLAAAEKADIRDIEGVRDLIRGTFGSEAGNFARIARSANMLNYVRSMGQVTLSSLPEAYRGAMVHGLRPFMQTVGKINTAGFKMSVKDAKLGGLITERALSHRLATLAEINNFYVPQTPFETFLRNMVEVASTWNGIRLWTDFSQTIASVMSQSRILSAAADFSKASARDKRYMNFVGIGEGMADRIGKQFDEFGETVDGVRVANTESWTDAEAKRAYYAALQKDIRSIVPMKSVADIPLFGNSPVGRMIFQFNTFNLASHQRVLLRGLQEGPQRFVAGAVALTSIGMMVTYLTGLAANRDMPDFAENPGWWLSEGVDRSGLFMVPMQLANSMEKLTGFNPIKAPIKAFDETAAQSMRLNNRNTGSLLGPSFGLLEDVATVAGIPLTLATGEEVRAGQKNAAERLLPYQSYAGMRQMLKYLVNPPADE